MKRIIFLLGIITILLVGCDKESLELSNPNQPTHEALKYESGMLKAGLGVYVSMRDNYYWWLPWGYHQTMGDVVAISAGNWNWRYANQTTSITDHNGNIYRPSQGGSQPDMLRTSNVRTQGFECPFMWEWVAMYGLNGSANLILSTVDEATYKGNADVKKTALKAWAYWWKGYAYSKIGSIYSYGVVVDKVNETNSNYLSHEEIVREAKNNFEKAKDLLKNVNESDVDFASVMDAVIPNYLKKGRGGVFTPSMLIRNINTVMARNILVNKYVSELSSSDLDEIETLCLSGINNSDFVFTVRNDASNDLVYTTAWSPIRILLGWENLSERLIQDFRSGDARFTRNIAELAQKDWVINPRGRGYQYGTRFYPLNDETDYTSSSNDNLDIIMSGCYEENQLMLAEVYIRKNQIEKGLGYIDAVRNYQNANLAPLVGLGLTKDEALEELRSERRVALFQKGPVCFYDARRWGVLKPVSQGGGRKNANVLFEEGVRSCTIDYNYLEWWDVPAGETDFNPMPSSMK